MSAARPPLADAVARRAAQEEFARPLVLEAGAGTGKTATLVARVVAWVVGPGWERAAARDADADPDDLAAAVLERVVAITFTEAAAAEMAERVGRALQALDEGTAAVGLDPACLPSAEVAGPRARRLLSALHRLEVRTIHAWCAGLLRRFPLEAALPPDFVVDATGARVAEAVQREIEAALRAAAGEDGLASWERLAAAGQGPAELAAALEILVREAAAPALLARDPFADRSEAVAAWAELADAARAFAALDRGRLAECPGKRATARTVCAAVSDLAERLAVAPPPGALAAWDDLAAAARAVPKKARERLAEWAAGVFKKSEAKRIAGEEPLVADAAAAIEARLDELAGLRPLDLDAARRVLQPLLARVQGRLRAAGVLTFADLLIEAGRLLTDADVAATVRRGLDQLLVDEFQDTDRLQCEIVRRIALEGPADQRPALFVVGDPKQSIYAWRSADLVAYEAFVDEVESLGGTVAPLNVNFRSVPPILAEVERVVGPIMIARPGLQPRFERLEPCPALAGVVPDEPAVEWWASWELGAGEARSDGSGAATEREARALAADLVRCRAAGASWSDVGVLLRTTSDLDVYLDELRAAGVPFQVARDREYYRSREVVEAAALLRLLLDPSDELALLTALRSDTVGVPDAALAPLWRQGLPGAVAAVPGADGTALAAVRTLVARAAGEVPQVPGLERVAGWDHALLALVEDLAALRPLLAAAAPAEVLEHLRALRQGDATAAARYLGGVRRTRLARFLREAEAVLESSTGAAAAGRALRRMVEEERSFEAAEGAPAPADAVQVMTVHHAKGLDFEHVYLCQLHKGVRSGGRRAAAAVARDGASYELLGWASPGFRAAEARAEAAARAERVRLLYVAATRAKRRLVLMGHYTASQKRGSMAELLTETAPLDQLRAQGESGRAVEDADGLRHVVCVLDERAVPSLAPPGRPAGRPVRPSEAGPEARARERRPWSAGASAEAHARLERTEPAESPAGADGDRQAAMAAGSVVHRFLEALEGGRDAAAQADEEIERAERGEREGTLPPGTARLARGLLDRLAAGPLLDRLEALADAVVARELPVLLPPSDGGSGPVGFVSGFVDLVYRDPSDDALVVVDYKTDRVEEGPELTERAGVYAPQLALYARALQEALELPEPPRTELWFLWPGRVVRTR